MEVMEDMEVSEVGQDMMGDYNYNNVLDKPTTYWRRSHSSSCGSSAASPDTEEFESLERRLHSELEQKLVERERRVSDMSNLSDRKLSDISHGPIRKLSDISLMSDRKLSDISHMSDMDGEPVSLQLVEKRQLRTFSRADEYLYAMKEDLAEWFNLLYPHINIDADNFMETLQTGEHLLRHANAVRHETLELVEKIKNGEVKRKMPSFSVPENDLPIRENVTPGTWFARDNVYNFIKFCRLLEVMDVVMFETEDLVSSKNEKHVVLTLLEVARRGAKIGMLAPMLVQFEQEIDQQIAREEKERKKKEKEEREQERQAKEEEKARKREEREREAARVAAEREAAKEAAREAALAAAAAANDDADLFPSLAVEVEDDTVLGDVEDDYANGLDLDDEEEEEEEEYEEEDEEEEEEEEEDMEGYPYPIGPMPQIVSNDLRSLDEMVRDLVSECQCPSQFPMNRVSEGRYRIGDTSVMIFVRILRSHVMVRVGGGWDTLQNYLDKHDPCRCRRGHRSTLGAHMSVRTNRSPMAVGVTYDRSESPGTSKRRSSASTVPPRRGSSYCSPSNYDTPHSPSDKTRSFSRQWDSPRGSLTGHGTLPRDSPRGSIVSAGVLPRSRSPSAPFTGAVGSQSPSATRRMMGRAPPPQGATAKISKSNGPSPLLKDGLEPSLSRLRTTFDTDPGGGTASQVPKDETRLPSRSDSGLSLVKDKEGRLTLCDSGSEVSDEGYKSSHGNVSKIEDNAQSNADESSKSLECSVPDRPESSLTVGSECSSTISTDDGRTDSPVGEEDQGSSSPTITTETEEPTVVENKEASSQLSPTTKSRLASLLNKIPKLGRSKKPASDTSPDISDKEISPTQSAKTISRINSRQNIYRDNSRNNLSRNNSHATLSRNNSNSSAVEHSSVGLSRNKSSNAIIRNNSSSALNRNNSTSTLNRNNSTSTLNRNNSTSTLNRNHSSNGTFNRSVGASPSPSRHVAGEGHVARPPVTRSRSMSSDNGRLSRQGSYRAPRGTSRYMQAAQAYASRKHHVAGGAGGGSTTWSATCLKTQARPAIGAETFQAPRKLHSRTASASPGLQRRKLVSSSNQTSPTSAFPPAITSTHSTPSKRPQNRRISPVNKDPLFLGDVESDELILKRMEEILFTYKSKVEDKLAAEGKELPKDIFEDFTSHWVNSSPYRAKSMDSLDSSEKSSDKSLNCKKVRIVPTPRQEHREGHKLTKIPVPTFYKSPIPSETHL